MGLSSSVFSREELEEYADLTYFTEGEILDLYKKFTSLLDEEERDSGRESRIDKERMKELSEIKHNPFADRLCDVFSTSGSNDGSMSFDDFLDMMNALSEHATFKLKTQYAFQIFDMDADGYVGPDDIQEIVRRITHSEELIDDTQMMDELIDSMMDEADLDKDGQLSMAEFEHVLSKSPDFMNAFKIRV